MNLTCCTYHIYQTGYLFPITVDRDNLICDDDDDDDNAVCGTNGVTYPSLCRLLQETGNEAVAYAGECDRDECQRGPVSD